jgi:hypothetical protein
MSERLMVSEDRLGDSGNVAMTDPTDQTTLYRGGELIADLVVNGNDFHGLTLTCVHMSVSDVRPYSARNSAARAIDNHVEAGAAYESPGNRDSQVPRQRCSRVPPHIGR